MLADLARVFSTKAGRVTAERLSKHGAAPVDGEGNAAGKRGGRGGAGSKRSLSVEQITDQVAREISTDDFSVALNFVVCLAMEVDTTDAIKRRTCFGKEEGDMAEIARNRAGQAFDAEERLLMREGTARGRPLADVRGNGGSRQLGCACADGGCAPSDRLGPVELPPKYGAPCRAVGRDRECRRWFCAQAMSHPFTLSPPRTGTDATPVHAWGRGRQSRQWRPS